MVKLLAKWADVRPAWLAVFNFYVCRWFGWRMTRRELHDGKVVGYNFMRWPNRKWDGDPLG